MKNQLYPCLWFDGQAQEAATFYSTVFPNSIIKSSNPLVTIWEIDGQRFMGLNGGPMFKPNPSVSFFVTCETKEEIDLIWSKLSENATIMMALDSYGWSPYYGFLKDKYGVSWQIYLGKYEDVKQKVVPSFLFTDKLFGRANEAINYYTKVFTNSKIDGVLFYEENEMPQKEVVKHAQFVLNETVFMAMDGAGNHDFAFNEATSFVIQCETQEQIDFYWNRFVNDGGKEGMCGWCKDKFGVSWQIVPEILEKLMSNPSRREQVTAAFMKMKKFDIEVLQNA